jgi:hypothetical protein
LPTLQILTNQLPDIVLFKFSFVEAKKILKKKKKMLKTEIKDPILEIKFHSANASG